MTDDDPEPPWPAAPAPPREPAPPETPGDAPPRSAEGDPPASAPPVPPPLDGDGDGAYPPAAEVPEPPDLWDQFTDWAMQRGALAGLGVLTLGMLILYAPMFRGELAGDDLTFHMAESARISDCLRAFDFDLWNPSANAGFASAYYYQVVPQLVSAIPAAMFGHHLLFFELSVFLPLVLAPAAAYRGMRLLGATPWQATIAALAIGFLNGQSRWGTGNAGTFSVGLYTQTWALAAFPIALGHAVRWATSARGLAPAIAWGAFVTLCHPFAGVSLGLALLAGCGVRPAIALVDLVLFELAVRRHPEPDRGIRGIVMARLFDRWRVLPRPWIAAWLGELGRLAILGGCLIVAWMPIWLPLIIDYEGFGGFPHRVNDEVGPGFGTLADWYVRGAILDYARPVVLTWTLPFVAVFARARFFRWLWGPIGIYALGLGIGPHIGKTDDDLLPAVRVLGAMQVALALAIGAGGLMLLKALWNTADTSPLAHLRRPLLMALGLAITGGIAFQLATLSDGSPLLVAGHAVSGERLSQGQVRWICFAAFALTVAVVAFPAWLAMRSPHGVRTGLAAITAVLVVLLIVPGAIALGSRVHVLPDYEGSHGDELLEITRLLQREPPGRKQVGAGAENHWWNLLSYEYGRRPSLLMMGGGGLQASPNYDFLWTVKDFAKNAWVYDAPILVFEKKNAGTMPSGDEILSTKNYQARRLIAPGLVSPVQVTGTLPPGRKAAHAAAIEWFKSEAPRNDQVLAYDGSGGPGEPPHGTTLRALRQDSPGDAPDIIAEVDVTALTTFVARESWHPRWRAHIDGVEVPVRRVTPDFPALDVGPGHHVISFRFLRPWWAHASWLAWPLVPLLAWLTSRLRRRPPGSPGTY